MYRILFLSLWWLASPVCAATHHPQDFLNAIKGTKDEGEQVVQHFCADCHAERPLIPLGAPRIKQHTDWDGRIKLGIDKLLQHTDEGLNAMPPRGGCFECTDEQLKSAIAAMLPDSLKKHVTN